MTIKKVSLTSSQAEFVQLTQPFTLFCGGYGSGKSHTMGLLGVMDMHHSANVVVGFYEPDYSKIKTIAYPNVEKHLVDMGVRYKLNQQDHAIYTSSAGVGDALFLSMDNPDLLVGYETYSSHLDELDTLTEEKAQKAWRKILGRNRQNPSDVPKQFRKYDEAMDRWDCLNKMRVYTTPEGFKFCYKTWGMNTPDRPDYDPDFAMVQACSIDNTYLSTEFIRQLTKDYPERVADAYLRGQFVNMESGTVYYAFSRTTHDSTETIVPGETLRIGCDFNVGKMAFVVYKTTDAGKIWHAVDEGHSILDTPMMINVIKSRYAGHKIIMYPDSTGAHRTASNASISSIALLRNAGFEVRAKKTNPNVVDRVAATNQAFSDRIVLVNVGMCPEFTRCLEQQCYDKNGAPDKANGTDHQNDAGTYPIAYEHGITKPIFKIDYKFHSRGDYFAR